MTLLGVSASNSNGAVVNRSCGSGYIIACEEAKITTDSGSTFVYGADRRHYDDITNSWPPNADSVVGRLSGHATADFEKDRLPVMSSKYAGVTWAQVASATSGTIYTNIRNRGLAIKSWQDSHIGQGKWGCTFVWTFHHEPNNDSGAAGMAASDWRAAIQNIVTIWQSVGVRFWTGTNTGVTTQEGIILSIVLITGETSGGYQNDWDTWWPPSHTWMNANMVCAAGDGYNNGDVFKPFSYVFQTFKSWTDAKRTSQAAAGKTFLASVAETGCQANSFYTSSHSTWTATGLSRTKFNWFQNMADYIQTSWPLLHHMCYWDSTVVMIWTLDTTQNDWDGFVAISDHAAWAEGNVYNIVLNENSDVDQTASLQNQLNAVPNGTASIPNIIHLPAGRYRIDGAISLNVRQHLRITCPDGVATFPNPPSPTQAFVMYTDKLAVDLGLGSRRHLTVGGCTDVVVSFVMIDGPWLTRDPEKPLFSKWSSGQFSDAGMILTTGGSGGLFPCTDCAYEDCYVINTAGDGYAIQGSTADNQPASINTGCWFTRCAGAYAGRHGLTLTNCDGLEVTDFYHDWNGYGGMDCEPNQTNQWCYNVDFLRVKVGGKIGAAFSWTGGNSNPNPRKKNIRMTDCEALHASGPAFKFGSSINQSGTGGNDGYCILDTCRDLVNTSTNGITISNFDDIVVTNCTLKCGGGTAVSTAMTVAARDSITITNNVCNGFTEGFDQLYVASIPSSSPPGSPFPVVVHYGNVWAMGTQNDGIAPPVGNAGPIYQILPPLQQAAVAGPVTEVDAVVATTLPVLTQRAVARSGGRVDIEIGFTGVFGEAPMSQFQLANIGGTVEGIVAQTLPALTQALMANASLDIVIAQTLPAVTQLVEGYHGYTAVIDQTLPPLRQAETGSSRFGPIDQTLPALVGAAVGDVQTGGAIAQTLPALTQAVTGVAIELDAVVDQTLPALTQAVLGHVSGAISWPEWPVDSSDEEWLVRV